MNIHKLLLILLLFPKITIILTNESNTIFKIKKNNLWAIHQLFFIIILTLSALTTHREVNV